MDCPYIVRIKPETHLWDSSCTEYVTWLRQNNITKFDWKWTDNGMLFDPGRGLIFRFENERDKIYFALRWA